jgi:hypothetical protein
MVVAAIAGEALVLVVEGTAVLRLSLFVRT